MMSDFRPHTPDAAGDLTTPRGLYFALLQPDPSPEARSAGQAYLARQLEATASLPCELPEQPEALMTWMDQQAAQVGDAYQAYLEERKAGAPRRYFQTKSHALYFLKSVAPTKAVDGAWLYGLLQRWNDARFYPLIRIYLEELGDGEPEKNHVLLYKKLLATHGCEGWEQLDDSFFVQGALQLALGYGADQYLPEVIGFNLGYEMLPLHLLITAYELNELGIDPYYFTLHITVDNPSTGHARKAVQGVMEALPLLGDSDSFWQRLCNGYRLNSLGAGTCSVIEHFNLDQEVVAMLAAKSEAGRYVHSDYCRIGGHTVNEWLATPDRIREFLAALEAHGWIRRNQPPENSRFWRLIEGERAEMFGVFTAYEQQLLHDWIAGESALHTEARPNGERSGLRKRQPTFRAKQRMLERLAGQPNRSAHRSPGLAEALSSANPEGMPGSDFDSEEAALASQLKAQPDREAVMNTLVAQLAPALHATPAGLKATQLFARLLG